MTYLKMIVICVVLLFSSLHAKLPYTPKLPDPALQPWRWKLIEQLNGNGYRCMVEDKDHNMWFGVDDGVYCYDGYSWILYTPEDGLAGAPVTALYADDESVYAASRNGISRYFNGQWEQVFPHEGSLGQQINSIVKTSDGILWIATPRGLLRVKGSTVFFCGTEEDKKTFGGLAHGWKMETPLLRDVIQNNGGGWNVYSLYTDRQGYLWIGLQLGQLLRFQLSSESFVNPAQWEVINEEDGISVGQSPIVFQRADHSIVSVTDFSRSAINFYNGKTWRTESLLDVGGNDIHTSITETPDGTLWIGGWHFLYMLKDNQWTTYRNPMAPVPVTRMHVYSDSRGFMWVGGINDEVLTLDYNTGQWTTYNDLNYQCEAPDGRQWFIEWDNAVVSFDPSTHIWEQYTVDDGVIAFPSRVFVSSKGLLFASGAHRGVAAVAFFKEKRWIRKMFPTLSWGFTDRAVMEDLNGRIWFGPDSPVEAVKDGIGGIVNYNPAKGEFNNPEAWTHLMPPAVPTNTAVFGETADGKIWLHDYPIKVFDGVSTQPVTEPERITRIHVDCIYTTKNREIWIGSRGNGVFYYDNATWTNYTVHDGLISNTIASLLQTQDGNIWAATLKGISRFDGQTWTTRVLPEAMFVEILNGALHQSGDGAIWISNTYRSWMRRGFSNDSVERVNYATHQTTRYMPDDEAPETEILMYEQTVSHPGNAFFKWTGTDSWDITNRIELKYSYRLDDNEWSAFTDETDHVFPKVPRGKHTFEVRARDTNFNIDPFPAKVSFSILPPWYFHPIFIMLVCIMVVTIVYYESKLILKNKRLRNLNQSLSLKTDELEASNNELVLSNKDLEQARAMLTKTNLEMNRSNSELEQFAYIASHDLQEPLRKVQAFGDRLQSKYGNVLDERGLDYLKRMQNAANRMQLLINNLLSYSRVTTKAQPFRKIDLNHVLQDVVSDLETRLENTGGKVEVNELPVIEGEHMQMHQLFQNLIGNALKFQKSEQKPKVRVYDDRISQTWNDLKLPAAVPGFCRIIVEDNGIGIDERYQDRIFQVFQRLHGKSEYEGTGIGLAICRKIVDWHQGTIMIRSVSDVGTIFILILPLEQKK